MNPINALPRSVSIIVFSFLHQFKILLVFLMLLIERNLLQPEDIQFLNIQCIYGICIICYNEHVSKRAIV